MKSSILIFSIVLGLALTSCNEQLSLNNENIVEYIDSTDNYANSTNAHKEFIKYKNLNPIPDCLNSVAGHDERDTIWGNFTGNGIDTLYIVSEFDTTANDYDEMFKYYAVSSNKSIPKVRMYGNWQQPKLVFEGDLDQNGTDEWGYLHTWLNSQWRYYRVFTLVKHTWRYLIDDENLSTPEWFRCSGKEIVEPADSAGYVKLNYGTFGSTSCEIRDTIVKATYSKIKD
ncbi:MAG: hypothetical protein IK025_11570 [Bacteroidales bacterium]|nr:hypothetical protein [Bacteroidales bacterium]